MILGYLSAQPMERIRVGCILNIGSVYSWEDNELEIRGKEGAKHKTARANGAAYLVWELRQWISEQPSKRCLKCFHSPSCWGQQGRIPLMGLVVESCQSWSVVGMDQPGMLRSTRGIVIMGLRFPEIIKPIVNSPFISDDKLYVIAVLTAPPHIGTRKV